MSTLITALNLTKTVTREEEFVELYRKHHQMVYRTARHVTGCPYDAEDVLQEIFAALLGRELPPALQKNPGGYLYCAAVNRSLKILQARKRETFTDEADRSPAPAPQDESRRENDERKLRNLLATLSPDEVEILLLRYKRGYSYADIAKIVGKTQAIVGVTLFRLRHRLKKLVEKEI